MKIVYFTSGGPFGLRPLVLLAADHEIVAVVRPRDPAPTWRRIARVPAQWARLRNRDVVGDWLKQTRIPSISTAGGDDQELRMALGPTRPDLICIATFPRLLSQSLLDLPRHGVVNLHPSYLPRHRGANPLFWTYHCGDREGGVTAHMANAREDAGPILLQERIEIPRGWPSSDYYMAMAEAGSRILHVAVDGIDRGTLRPVPQEDRLATRAPRLRGRSSMIDPSWDVEHTWHFLAGLNPWYKDPIATDEGQTAEYGDILGFERGAATGAVGRARRSAEGWVLACRDGQVHLGRRRRLPQRVPRVESVTARGVP